MKTCSELGNGCSTDEGTLPMACQILGLTFSLSSPQHQHHLHQHQRFIKTTSESIVSIALPEA